jgi:hypothetical protein
VVSDAPFLGLTVLVGVAPNVKEITLENTEIGTGRTVNFADQEVTTCVFHLDIEPGMEGFTEDSLITIDRITDIAFINGTGDSLPPGTSIGVAVKLGDIGSVHDHTH